MPEPPDYRPFASLREESPAGKESGTPANYLAIAEIQRFLPLRNRIGYTRANALMQQIAARLADAAPSIAVGRIARSSVEFAFPAASRAAAEQLLARTIAAIETPLSIDGLELALGVTIGAVDLGASPVDDAAVDLAAAALTDASRLHEPLVIIDGSAPASQAIDDFALLRGMDHAMQSGELQLYYQPKLRVRSNRIEAVEALIRWHHPIFGLVPTEPFIRLVEQTGGIRRLTEWVIARAVLDRATFTAAGYPVAIWINLSGMLLADAKFTARALELIEGSDGGIGFEITETAVIDNPERAMANLASFTAAGVRIAIDDYGSGLSSLAYLKQLPADELKIDRLFIKELIDSHRDPLLVRSSIDLAHALEMEVTAEGVDDAMTLSLLKIMGCDMIQGYLIAEPMPLPRLLPILADVTRLDDLASPMRPGDWHLPRARAQR